MRKAMISQPMNGLDDMQIAKTRSRAIEALHDMNFEVVHTWFSEKDIPGRIPRKIDALYLLGRALEEMSNCDLVYFCKGWETARGCQIEHMAAKAYGLTIWYE